MRITKIEKKKRRYLMELDSDERLYITEDTIIRFLLSKDKDLSDDQLLEIKSYNDFSYGKNLALYHLSFKQRTAREVRDYLESHDVPQATLSKIITHLKEENWINDRKYVQSIAESNLLSGNKGAFLLKQKLMQKGLAASLIDEELAAFDFSIVANRTAEKLIRSYQRKMPPKALKDKVIQNLSQKGFSYRESLDAFETVDFEEDQDQTSSLLEKEVEKIYRKYSKKYDGYELRQRMTKALARKGFDFDDIASTLRDYF